MLAHLHSCTHAHTHTHTHVPCVSGVDVASLHDGRRTTGPSIIDNHGRWGPGPLYETAVGIRVLHKLSGRSADLPPRVRVLYILPVILRRVFKKGKGMFLYSAVSSPWKAQSRPVHSDTNLTSLGSILAMQQLCAKTIQSHFHHFL